MYYNREDIGKSTVQKEVKEYCELESCRRDFLSIHFGTPNSIMFTKTQLHLCCDNCQKLCECSQCIFDKEHPPIDITEDNCQDNSVEEMIHTALVNVFSVINNQEQTAIETEPSFQV